MDNIQPLHILAFGAHPDDVEIGMGGTLVKYARKGYRVGICDLTKAELSSNGTVEIRQQEAKKASEILQLTTRIQLDFPDRGIIISKDQMDQIVDVIRTYKPTIVFAPHENDRHPDHGQCAVIVKEAVFNSRIRKYREKEHLPAFAVKHFYKYMINGFHKPDFYIDISDVIEQKIEALMAYQSQFTRSSNSIDTPLTDGYIESVQAREKLFGKEASVSYAEGFMKETPIIIDNLLGE